MTSEANRPEVRLLHDPGPEDELPPDAFGVEELADRLTHLVAAAGPPFTISLSGAWGIGKTTLAETVRRRSGILVASVDLWSLDINHLRRSIVIEIGTLLGGDSPDARETVAQELDRELRVSRADTTPEGPRLRLPEAWRRIRARPELGIWALTVTLWWIVALLVVTTIPGAVGQVLGQVLTAIAIFLLIQSGLVITVAATTETRAPAEAQVATLRRYSNYAAVSDADQRPVLLILDNLDRLTGAEALRALGEIRALVDLPRSRCVFMIPVDRTALARHLADQVGSDDQVAARDFLDKLFQRGHPAHAAGCTRLADMGS